MKNWMTEKLLPHVGHEISCVAYGNSDDPSDVCIECEDCYTVLVSAEDFNQDMAGEYKITQRLRIGGRTLLMGHNPEDKEAPLSDLLSGCGFSGLSPLHESCWQR